MTDMVYTVYRSKHAGGPSGLKRMQVVPKDANNRNFSPDHWDKLFNIRVKYKRPFLVDLAVKECFQYLDHFYPSAQTA